MRMGQLVCRLGSHAVLASLLAAAAVSAATAGGALRGRVLRPAGAADPGGARSPSRREATDAGARGHDRRGGLLRPRRAAAAPLHASSPRRPASPRARYDGLEVAVGQSYRLDISLGVVALSETVQVIGRGAAARARGRARRSTASSAPRAIEQLPLNGRNFLELAFLVPGNVPTPNFDPTKTNSVVVASAGQIGRGGMITIDGADNNDDVVGGPLQNLPAGRRPGVPDRHQPLHRRDRSLGRRPPSTSSPARAPTSSAATPRSSSATSACRALPATYDRSQEAPPFSRQQYALSLGGPLKRGVAHWFGALEYRDQDGAVLVGERDVADAHDRAALRRRRRCATGSASGASTGRRLGQRPADRCATPSSTREDTGASTLDRSIGSASQRQASTNGYHAVLGTWVRTLSSSQPQHALGELQPVPQLDRPGLAGHAAAHVPVDPGRQLLPRAAGHGPGPLPALGQPRARARRPQPQARRRGAAGEGRASTSASSRPAASRWSRTSPDFDHNGDGRVDDDDLLFAVTLRSGFPDRNLLIDDCNNTYLAFFAQDDWRVTPELTLNLGLRWEMDTDVKNVSGYGEHEPAGAATSTRATARPTRTTSARASASTGRARAGTLECARRLGDLLRPHHARDRVARARPRRPRAADRGEGGQRLLPRSADRPVPAVRAVARQPVHRLRAAGRGRVRHQHHRQRACSRPQVQQWNLGAEVRVARDLFLRVDGVYDKGTHFLIGRTVGQVENPVVGGPDRVVNLESSVGTRYKGALRLGREARRAPPPARLLHPVEGRQLRERRPDPVLERPHRPERPRARVRPEPERPPAPLHARRDLRAARRLPRWRRS